MQTPWIEPRRLERALQRNEAFWRGGLEEGPLLWITVPNAWLGPDQAAAWLGGELALAPRLNTSWVVLARC